MTSISVHRASPTLFIDGVARALHSLTVLRRNEHLPGGIGWTLEFEASAVQHHLPYVPLRSGQPSKRLELQLFSMLRKVLAAAGRPYFCIATIDHVEVRDTNVRLHGTCTVLGSEAAPRGGLTRR